MKTLFARILSFFSAARSPSDAWSVGGIYATHDEDGTFGIVKILKVDERGVHLRVYSNKFNSVPQSVDESSLYRAARIESLVKNSGSATLQYPTRHFPHGTQYSFSSQ